MAAPTPMEIRACILEAHNDGCTQNDISDRYGVSQSTVSKLIGKYKRNQHILPGKAKGRAPLLSDDDCKTIRNIVKKKPDITLAGIQEQILIQLKKSVAITTVWEALNKLNLRRKRKSRYAEERNRDDVKKKKRLY